MARFTLNVLQEKYNAINDVHILNEETNNIEFVNDIFKYIKGITLEEAEELIHYVDTKLRRINGFHPDGETITEIYFQFAWIYGEDNGLIDTHGASWKSPADREKAKKHVMQEMYNACVGERKRLVALNKDNPGIEMDI